MSGAASIWTLDPEAFSGQSVSHVSCLQLVNSEAMADIKKASQVLENYKKLIVSGQHDTAKSLLTDLKLLVVQFPALPPACAQSNTSQQELMIARDMLEQSVLLAVKMQVCQLPFNAEALSASVVTDCAKVVAIYIRIPTS